MRKSSRSRLGILALAFVVSVVLVATFATIAAASPDIEQICSDCHTGAGAAPGVSAAAPVGGQVTYTVTPSSSAWAAFDLTAGIARVGHGLAGGTFTAPVGDYVRVCQADGSSTGTWTQAYILTPKAETGGAISPATPQIVAPGGSKSFTITPSGGTQIADVKVNDVSSPGAVTAGSYTFPPVQADASIVATFGYTITATAGANGTITPTGAQIAEAGKDATYTVTPSAGYMVDTVLVDGAAATLASGKYIFAGVSATHTIAVTFKASKSTVSLALTGLKSGKLTLGKKVTCTGVLKPARAAKATLTFQRKVGSKWVKVTAKSVAVNATIGKYTFAYKPTKKGSWRVQAVVAGSPKATSVYKTFTVK